MKKQKKILRGQRLHQAQAQQKDAQHCAIDTQKKKKKKIEKLSFKFNFNFNFKIKFNTDLNFFLYNSMFKFNCFVNKIIKFFDFVTKLSRAF